MGSSSHNEPFFPHLPQDSGPASHNVRARSNTVADLDAEPMGVLSKQNLHERPSFQRSATAPSHKRARVSEEAHQAMSNSSIHGRHLQPLGLGLHLPPAEELSPLWCHQSQGGMYSGSFAPSTAFAHSTHAAAPNTSIAASTSASIPSSAQQIAQPARTSEESTSLWNEATPFDFASPRCTNTD